MLVNQPLTKYAAGGDGGGGGGGLVVVLLEMVCVLTADGSWDNSELGHPPVGGGDVVRLDGVRG